MPRNYKMFDVNTGKEFDANVTVTIDHATNKFEIVVKSSSGLTEETIRNLIQTKFEVLNCNLIDSRVYCKR